MAEIYQKSITDKTLLFYQREAFMRPFNFGNWTEIRVGLYFSPVASGSNNSQSLSNETLTLSSNLDRIYFGIKSSGSNLPGFLGTDFIGVTNTSNASFTNLTVPNIGHAGGAGFNNSLVTAVSKDSTFTTNGGTSAVAFRFGDNVTGDSSSYANFYGIRINVSGSGTPSQSINISTNTTYPVSGTDYSVSSLRNLLNNSTYTTSTALAWNNGSSSYSLPNMVFLYMPFFSNSIRVSCIEAIQYT